MKCHGVQICDGNSYEQLNPMLQCWKGTTGCTVGGADRCSNGGAYY